MWNEKDKARLSVLLAIISVELCVICFHLTEIIGIVRGQAG